MHLDTAFFHEICILVLYGCIAAIAFIVLERLFYYGVMRGRLGTYDRLAKGSGEGAALPAGGDPVSASVAAYLGARRNPKADRENLEDLSGAAYLALETRVNARLWLLDTIVTAAPLIGLLGTILGIMDTFTALSAGGISDPAAVSRGIAAALLATAIGIGTALFGLIGYNLLHRAAEAISDRMKGFLLVAA